MSALHTAMYELAKARRCVLCKKRCCRVDVDRADRFVAGWLCHGCFEDAPSRFKLTDAQHQFRDLVTAGMHPKLALRRCSIATRHEPLRDMSAEYAWFKRALEEP